MAPEDDLALRIAAYVKTQVPAEQAPVVTRATCLVIATLMADPTFTEELVVVKALREENRWLRTNYQILKQMMDRVGVKKAAPRKRSASGPKKPPARPKNSAGGSSTPRAKGTSPQRPRKSAPNSSFRQGFDEMRG